MKNLVLAATFALFGLVSACNAQTSQPLTEIKSNLKFEETIHKFGEIPQGVPATANFEFKNTGKEPVILKDVKASCGCTAPTWPKEPILPGKKGTIGAQYNAAAPGPFTKTVTVTTGAGETIVLTIQGEVKANK